MKAGQLFGHRISSFPPEATLRRLLIYLEYFKKSSEKYLSSFQIANFFKFTAIQVRKDIAFTKLKGRPKYGYLRKDLIRKIEKMLKLDASIDAFLIGAGNLGKALASYTGFSKYSVNIAAIGDHDPKLIGKIINGKMIYSMHKSIEFIKEHNIKLIILALPGGASQKVANMLIDTKIRAIWNFSSVRLDCPKDIIIQNEDLGASLSVLCQKLIHKKR